MSLTARQAEILQLLIDHLLEHHAAATVRDLSRATRTTSTNNMAGHLRALERKGFIARPGRRVGIRILRWPDGRSFRLEARACEPNECPTCGRDTGGLTHHCPGRSPARA